MLFLSAFAGCGGLPTQGPQPVAPPTRQAPAANSELMFQVLTSLGIDYLNGGRSPSSGFDCSGLVAHVYLEAFGVRLPHNTLAQSRIGSTVEPAHLVPGDLVFFNTLNRPYSHVGIYLGDGRFVHAPKTGAQVRVEHIQTRYWVDRFNGARRIAGAL